MSQLQGQVVCRHSVADDPLRVTGIPPHISLLGQMKQISDDVRAVIPVIASAQQNIIHGVIDVLEERAIGAEL